METGNFLAWVGAIALIAGGAIATMTWAYVGSGSRKVRFTETVPTATPGASAADLAFQQGCEAFQAGNYRKALDCFTRTLQEIDSCAEAYHNRGLAQANLRQDNEAVRSLVKAGELYLERSDIEGYERIKDDLKKMQN